MPQREHRYSLSLAWTGNLGEGTSGYPAYSRNHPLSNASAEPILGSANPAFRGDPGRWSPEKLLIGALAEWHML